MGMDLCLQRDNEAADVSIVDQVGLPDDCYRNHRLNLPRLESASRPEPMRARGQNLPNVMDQDAPRLYL